MEPLRLDSLRICEPLWEDPKGERTISPIAPSHSSATKIKDFSPLGSLRQTGYQRLVSDGSVGEMSPRGEAPSPGEIHADTAAQGPRTFEYKPSSPGTSQSSPSITLDSTSNHHQPSGLQSNDPWKEGSAVIECVDTSYDPGRHHQSDGAGVAKNADSSSVISEKKPRDLDDTEMEEFDDQLMDEGFAKPPTYCDSKGDIYTKRSHWLAITIFVLSVYSTIGSGIWFIVAAYQPRWGAQISSTAGMSPATATTITALLAKSIEMAFVTVFISWLGQVLTRRAIHRNTHGITLSEMTMRNWVVQPGSLITHGAGVGHVATTVLGALTLTATLVATLYTTASDAMVAPKLKFGKWENRLLNGRVLTSYANVQYAMNTCPTLMEKTDSVDGPPACLQIKFSGQSYRNLMNYMTIWNEINENGTGISESMSERPVGTNLLFDNTTMESSWILQDHANVTTNFEKHGRIINNVSLAMPHPGVYTAATSKENRILQPAELSGVGEYSIRASVVSPALNVMCVNMNRTELAPLIYTAWPYANVTNTTVTNQVIGWEGWEGEVPRRPDGAKKLNRTVVDEVFRWGPKYDRQPPIFRLYPADNNLLTNSSVIGSSSTSIYMLGKKAGLEDYTLCELQSWLFPECSTQFDISGTTGAKLQTRCEDKDDENSYMRSVPSDAEFSPPNNNWMWFADSWRLSMDLNGGTYNNNASNARILTQLALTDKHLDHSLPSMAEALAVFASSTLVLGAIDTSFKHNYVYATPELGAPGALEQFQATVRTQEYTSGHVNDWQKGFYIILITVFGINLYCMLHFIVQSGLVTDFTEPQNLFSLALNSPPSEQIKGSCGAGPGHWDLQVPWRIAMARKLNHYFFAEATAARLAKGDGGRYEAERKEELRKRKGESYKRLSSPKHGWL